MATLKSTDINGDLKVNGTIYGNIEGTSEYATYATYIGDSSKHYSYSNIETNFANSKCTSWLTSGTLGVARGGTGISSLSNTSGKYLMSNGSGYYFGSPNFSPYAKKWGNCDQNWVQNSNYSCSSGSSGISACSYSLYETYTSGGTTCTCRYTTCLHERIGQYYASQWYFFNSRPLPLIDPKTNNIYSILPTSLTVGKSHCVSTLCVCPINWVCVCDISYCNHLYRADFDSIFSFYLECCSGSYSGQYCSCFNVDLWIRMCKKADGTNCEDKNMIIMNGAYQCDCWGADRGQCIIITNCSDIHLYSCFYCSWHDSYCCSCSRSRCSGFRPNEKNLTVIPHMIGLSFL